MNRYSYAPFGGIINSNVSIPNPFESVGEFGVASESFGGTFMRERFYSPSLGRFYTQDPLNLVGGDMNFYRYAGNAPTFIEDPMGASWTFTLQRPISAKLRARFKKRFSVVNGRAATSRRSS